MTERIIGFLITFGQGSTAPAGSPAGPMQFIVSMGPMILIFVIMYLLLIRPQQKRTREHSEMVTRLKTGDRIVTNGGIHGKVTGAKEETLMIEVADRVEVEVSRAAIARVLAKE